MNHRVMGIFILLLLILLMVPACGMVEPKPELTIGDIRGGIGLNVQIKNVGTANATRVGYQVLYGGGLFLRTTKMIQNLPDIPLGGTVTLRTGFVRFGVGLGILTTIPWIELTIFAQDAENITMTLSARTLGALVLLQ